MRHLRPSAGRFRLLVVVLVGAAVVAMTVIPVLTPAPQAPSVPPAPPAPVRIEDQVLARVEASLGEASTLPGATIPVFGMLCTPVDAPSALRQLAGLDTGVRAYHVVFNGPDEDGRATAIFAEAQRRFGVNRFFFEHNPVNAGVSVGWNRIIGRGFAELDAEFVVVANADAIPHRGNWTKFAAFARDNVERCATLHFRGQTDFALFAVTRMGWRTLGSFDENVWPAYGEDTEYIVRGHAARAAMCHPEFRLYSDHIGSPNIQADEALKLKIHRHHNGQLYLRDKWGFDIFNPRSPLEYHFPFPYNDSRIPVTRSWLFDEAYRRCVETGVGVMEATKNHCLFPSEKVARLLAAGPPAPADDFLRKLQAALERGDTAGPDSQVVPLYGVVCTPFDRDDALRTLAALDVGVRAFAVVFNGQDPTGELTAPFRAAREQFGPEEFEFVHNADNAGVAAAWNAILRHGFR
eukprot:gene15599-23807_t